jgi:hypothetical protein
MCLVAKFSQFGHEDFRKKITGNFLNVKPPSNFKGEKNLYTFPHLERTDVCFNNLFLAFCRNWGSNSRLFQSFLWLKITVLERPSFVAREL